MAVKRPTFDPISPADRDVFTPYREPVPEPDPGPFRIGALSRVSGIPVGTIKYYLREGLIPPGRATAKTQALYGVDHLRRLRLLRVLADVGGMSIVQMRAVAAVLDDDDEQPGELEQAVSYALESPSAGRTAAANTVDSGDEPAGDGLIAARLATDAYVDWLGLEVDPQSPARDELAEALHALRTLGIADDPLVFSEHARLAYELAEFEIGTIYPITDRAAAAEAMTVGSVIFGAAFYALRRMSHEHEVRMRLDEGLGGPAVASAHR